MIVKVRIKCELCGKHTSYSYDDDKEPFWEPADSARSVYLEHLMHDHPDKLDQGRYSIEVV